MVEISDQHASLKIIAHQCRTKWQAWRVEDGILSGQAKPFIQGAVAAKIFPGVWAEKRRESAISFAFLLCSKTHPAAFNLLKMI
jgi:hypothetical protein